jgi:hypothetical protein
MKPSEIAAALEILVDLKQPALLTGEAGIGKSSIVRQVAAKKNCNLIDVRAVLLDAVDLRGLPHVNGDGRSHWAVPEFLPRDGAGILFLDELNRAPQLVQNACLQLTLERRIGEYELPEGWSVVAAGNPDTSRGVTRMSEALARRFVHLPAQVDVNDWCTWAVSHNMRPEVVAFIRFRPELLHSYDPKSTEKAFPNPGSWEIVSKILDKEPPDSVEHALYVGTVGEGAAGEFTSFLRIYRSLPSLDHILMHPKKAKVPEDQPATLYAIAAGLARKATEQNFDRVMTYADRMPKEWAVFLVKDATGRDEQLCNTPAFINFATANADIMG